MWEITAQTAGEYLVRSGRVQANEPVEVRELAGGVSNVVLLVTLPRRGERFVLKQSRERLRVQEDWRCSASRIWREVEVLRLCASLLERGVPQPAKYLPCVPKLLWDDRATYCFAMSAAPEEHQTWKEQLLAGWTTDSLFVAAACGRMLGRIHAGSWQSAEVARQFDDRSFFDALRLDPYYRHAALGNPDRKTQLQSLIDSVWSHRLCLVHGDFSPKNVLVSPGQAMLIDFEVGHFGDPAFDLGFFLTHLVAKSVHSREWCRRYLHLPAVFWHLYRGELATVATTDELTDLKQRMMLNLAGCLLARADGKSPLEYLTTEERQAIRTLGREWLVSPPDRLLEES